MRMYTGDLKPDLQITLSGDTPVDATAAEAIRVIGRRNGEVIFERAPSEIVVSDDTSVVYMEWETEDTETAGYIEIEVEVDWPGDRLQTFRPDSKVSVVNDFA